MVYYVIYRASAGFKNREKIPRRLRSMGVTQVHRSFWEVKEEKANTVLKILKENHPIFLKRIREIRKPFVIKEKSVLDLGSLIVIAYKIPKEVNRQKIKNYLEKAPHIRLCRSVYAFSHNHSRFDKREDLIDAGKFWNFIRKIDEDAIAIPRVVVVNPDSGEKLLEETKKRVKSDITKIIEGYNNLYRKVNSEETDEKKVRSELLTLKRRFATKRKIVAFYEKWFKTDLSKNLNKTYPAIKKVRSIIDEKYG